MNTLHITNGDSAVAIMKEAGITGTYLPWRDVLHDGPVPEGHSLESLSHIRADFISQCGWGNRETIYTGFSRRDDTLKSFTEFDNVILWFEHDLYDQLQILQILDWFYQHPETLATRLSMVCTDNYLGYCSPQELISLRQYEKSVSDKQLYLAHKAWMAFTSQTPESWANLLTIDTSALPFLKSAVIRLLQEYPSIQNGLSRTAQQVLQLMLEGENRLGQLFVKNQHFEESVYLGDASFCLILQRLLDTTMPLIQLSSGKTQIDTSTLRTETATITTAGHDILSCKQNWLDTAQLDYWIGGVHLKNDAIWYWNDSTQTLSLR